MNASRGVSPLPARREPPPPEAPEDERARRLSTKGSPGLDSPRKRRTGAKHRRRSSQDVPLQPAALPSRSRQGENRRRSVDRKRREGRGERSSLSDTPLKKLAAADDNITTVKRQVRQQRDVNPEFSSDMDLQPDVPGAYRVKGLTSQGSFDSTDYSIKTDDPRSSKKSDTKAAEGPDTSDLDTSGLKMATIVTNANEEVTLDETERDKIFSQAEREAEEKIKAAVVHAEVDDPEARARRRRCILIVVACLFVAIIAGATVGAVLGTRKKESNNEGTESPSPAPTPLVPFEPELDTCEGSRDVTEMVGVPMLSSTLGSSIDRADTCEIIDRNGRGIWYRMKGDGRTKMVSTFENTNFDTQVSVYTGLCGRLECVSGNDQFKGDQSAVGFVAVEGKDFFINIHGVRNSQGVFEMIVNDLDNNDECSDATQVTFDSESPIFGSTRGASLDSVAVDCDLAHQVAGGVWYTLPGVDGPMFALAETAGITIFRPEVSVYEGNNCNELVCTAGSTSGLVRWDGDSSKQYRILVHGLNANAGDFQFSVSSTDQTIPPPVQDDDQLLACEMAGEVPPGSMGRGNTFFGPPSDSSSCGRNVIGNSQGKWFTTTGVGGPMIASTCKTTTGFDTQISVYQGDNCDSLVCIDGNDQACGDQSTVVWHSEPGERYYILVHGTFGRTGEFNLTVDSEQTLGEPLIETSQTCEGAITLPTDEESVLGSFADAVTPIVGECAADVVDGNPGVWYEVTEGTGEDMTISACEGAGSAPLRLLVFTGTCDALECVEVTHTPCRDQDSVTWPSIAGQQYFVLAQSRLNADELAVSDNDGLFVLYSGVTAINNLCLTPIGPIASDNSLTVASSWSATIGEKPICDNTGGDLPTGQGIWYTTIGTGGSLIAHLCSELTSFAAQVRVFTGTCRDGFDLRCIDEQTRTTCEGGQGISQFQTRAGMLYYILVSGMSPAPSANLALSISRGNDICFGAEGPVPLNSAATPGSTITATVDDAKSVPSCPIVVDGLQQAQPFDASPGVWYEVTGNGRAMTVSTCGSATFESFVTVYGGPSCERLSCVEGVTHESCGGDENSNGIGMRATWQSDGGVTYWALVYGAGVGDFGFSLSS